MKRIVVGGAVYKQALRAPKKDMFEQFLPKLERWHKVALVIKQNLWKVYHSEPQLVLSTLEKLLRKVDQVPYSQDYKNLEKWVGGLGKVGMRLVDLENAGSKVVDQADDYIKLWYHFAAAFEEELDKTKNPAYEELARAVKSILDDATSTAQ